MFKNTNRKSHAASTDQLVAKTAAKQSPAPAPSICPHWTAINEGYILSPCDTLFWRVNISGWMPFAMPPIIYVGNIVQKLNTGQASTLLLMHNCDLQELSAEHDMVSNLHLKQLLNHDDTFTNNCFCKTQDAYNNNNSFIDIIKVNLCLPGYH